MPVGFVLVEPALAVVVPFPAGGEGGHVALPWQLCCRGVVVQAVAVYRVVVVVAAVYRRCAGLVAVPRTVGLSPAIARCISSVCRSLAPQLLHRVNSP